MSAVDRLVYLVLNMMLGLDRLHGEENLVPTHCTMCMGKTKIRSKYAVRIRVRIYTNVTVKSSTTSLDLLIILRDRGIKNNPDPKMEVPYT